MIRNYNANDFNACIELTSEIWKFKEHYSPVLLADFFQEIYTGLSLAESNFMKVYENNGIVKGFIFGKISNKPVLKTSYSSPLRILLRLLFLPKIKLSRKLRYFNLMLLHEKNRNKVITKKTSEVNLFVLSSDMQGKGIGKKLIYEFINACRKENLQRIILETDSKSNFGFYKHIGFNIIGKFHSPLLQDFSKDDGETYIYELKLN